MRKGDDELEHGEHTGAVDVSLSKSFLKDCLSASVGWNRLVPYC